MKHGFTLIELLVVVLIIGILAAVALPQYQKAVEKARAVEAFANLASLVKAEKVYKMANGQATRDLSQLDIQLSGNYNETNTQVTSRYFTYSVSVSGGDGTEGFEAIATRLDGGNESLKYYIYYNYSGSYNCVALNASTKWICKTLSGKTTPDYTPGELSYYAL